MEGIWLIKKQNEMKSTCQKISSMLVAIRNIKKYLLFNSYNANGLEKDIPVLKQVFTDLYK